MSAVTRAAGRIFVTGGAGFIGTSLVARLLADGHSVTVFDNLATAEPDWDAPFEADLLDGRLRFVGGDVGDLAAVASAMAGHPEVIHLAANTDIAGGFADPALDLRGCLLGTWNVAEAMRRNGIDRLLFASSGVVYGTVAGGPTPESYGPLRPESHYAAGKLAGEAILSAFAHLYGWRVLAFRFGNTIGPRSNHGVVHDFVAKLLRDPHRMEVLGDGRQRKPFMAIDDLVDAVLCLSRRAPPRPFTAYNVAGAGTLTVRRVAELVIEALHLDASRVKLAFADNDRGWAGDTPLVDLDWSALREMGWRPRHSAEEAVCWAASGLADWMRTSSDDPLTDEDGRYATHEVSAR